MPTAWDGIEKSIELIAEKKIKLIINGGALNPKGLAEKTHELARSKKLDLTVAYVLGDDFMHKVYDFLTSDEALPHLDSANSNVQLFQNTKAFKQNPSDMPIVSANAYLGMRSIKKGLEEGADIIICGRVADASPVIGAAAWWHGWKESIDFDALAGALIAGHLIECSRPTPIYTSHAEAIDLLRVSTQVPILPAPTTLDFFGTKSMNCSIWVFQLPRWKQTVSA